MFVLFCIVFYLIPKFSTEASAFSLLARQNIALDATGSLAPCICTDSRSIWDIVWSCVATIFACSWVAVHPDIPAPEDTWWTITLRRLEYMFWTIMTPELMIYWAARQWFGVRYFFSYPFHSAFNEGISTHKWTRTHAHFLQMGGFTLFDANGESKGILSRDRFRILLERKKINFPQITVKEIQDRSKSDGLAKVLVLGQTTWFVLQVVARRIQGLVTTEIEIATLAFAALNAVIYFFWWDKPFDVQTSVPVYLVSDVGSTNMAQQAYGNILAPSQGIVNVTKKNDDPIADESPKVEGKSTQSPIQFSLRTLIEFPRKIVRFVAGRLHNITENYLEFEAFQDIESSAVVAPSRVPLFYAIIATSQEEIKINIWVATIGAVFGAIHYSAWSFAFPSNAERWMWRIGSLVITGVPLIFLALMATSGGILKPISLRNQTTSKNCIQIHVVPYFFKALFPLYGIARLTLVVQAFIALRNLSRGAFDVVKWTTFIPHI